MNEIHSETVQRTNDHSQHASSSMILNLNVGGHLFSTAWSTLLAVPTSRLAVLFFSPDQLPKDEKGNYFIDRDGTYFKHILNFLRDGEYPPRALPLSDVEMIRKEAEHYGIKELISWGYYAQHEASGHSEWGQGMALESAQRHPSPSPASAPAWQPQEPPVWRTPPDTMAGAGGWAPPGAGPPPAILRRPPPHLVAPSTAGHPAAAAAHAAHMAALYPAAGPPRGTPAGGPKDAAASKKRRRPATREANAGGVSAGGVDAQGSLGGGRSAAPAAAAAAAGAGGGRAGRAPRGGAGVKKVGSAKGTAAHQSAVQGVTWNRSKACWEVTDHDGAGRKKRKTFSVKTYRTVEAARARAEAFRRQQLAEKFERCEIMKSSGTGGVPGAEPGEGTAAHSYYPDPATVGAGAGAYHGGLHSAGMALGPGGQASTQQQQQGVGYV